MAFEMTSMAPSKVHVATKRIVEQASHEQCRLFEAKSATNAGR